MIDMHEYPPLDAVGKDDDDKPLRQRRDDLTELVRHELRLVALLLGVHDMNALIQFVGRPCVVQYKEGGDDDQWKRRLEPAYHPTYQTAENE